ncbi:helix-turn-helix domain-containing protein [Streptomyces sp. BHT-5-2]|uniref:MmyB family transcriptional regulator n=1 Tax=Streptomyces sp. BHT-5-2 TaxID=2866715 RepID=UPI001C8D8E21|nr:helix-turn-helix domain-containing protein [Streptomyces sp. BHT-5-2]QZL06680.1 helix-turn-helix domain-containing protein [Streptomyces sp. BHT-5-2]
MPGGKPGRSGKPPAPAVVDRRTELSEFLRSRRARLRPEDVGLPEGNGLRRVPGLRREELAQLTGVSVAYYIRLEQGHVSNVSDAVLEALGTALRLTPTERDHLRHLVRPRAPRIRAARPLPARSSGPEAAPAGPQRVGPGCRQLLDAMELVPAFVLGRRLDVIGWNALGRAVFGDFAAMPAEHRNLARQVFLDPATRALYVNWEGKAEMTVSLLRRELGRYPDDPALIGLITELTARSEEFRRFWARHDIRDKGFGVKQLNHPVAGPLTLSYESLLVAADPEQVLVTHHAEAGTRSEAALRRLAAEAADVADAVERTDRGADQDRGD